MRRVGDDTIRVIGEANRGKSWRRRKALPSEAAVPFSAETRLQIESPPCASASARLRSPSTNSNAVGETDVVPGSPT